LYKFGFANLSQSIDRHDNLHLVNCRITNAVKCLPPANKPTGKEIRTCNCYLRSELAMLNKGAVILALGRVAHNAVLMALNFRSRLYPFRHGQAHAMVNGLWLLDCYHCSRYNTQTRRLTTEMFTEIFYKVVELLNKTI
jgi:uracil-DNA glycosylase